jgi:prepilin-type N-terminal cleavage/methylation domain-containing protein
MSDYHESHPPEREGTMSKPRGFTLVELVCVIATIAVISAIALPHWSAAVQDHQLNLAARRIIADLALAQSRANYGSASVTVAFNPAANSYQIVGMPDPDRPAQTYTVNLGADAYRVTISSVNFAGGTNLAFDGYGTPLAGGTIIIAQGAATRTLTVDATSGRVSN